MPTPPDPKPAPEPYPDLSKLEPSDALMTLARHVARRWGYTDGTIKIVIDARHVAGVKYKIKGRI